MIAGLNSMEEKSFRAMKGFLLLLVVCCSQVSAGFTNVYPKLTAHPLKNGEDVGEPLFLTPLIENGKIDDARNQSFVSLQGAEKIESYSGYFTVDKTYNSNMFFWFFPALVSLLRYIIINASSNSVELLIFISYYHYRTTKKMHLSFCGFKEVRVQRLCLACSLKMVSDGIRQVKISKYRKINF